MDSPEGTPVSLDSFYSSVKRSRVRETFFGKVRTFNTFTVLEWVYLAVSLLGLATSFGLSLERLFAHGLNTSDFTFAILLLITIVFCAYYVLDAVLKERGDELMIFVISNAIVLVYCVVNYITQTRSTIKKVRLIIVCILSPFLTGVGTVQSVKYCRSNNHIFHTVGAISSLQKACKMFYVCSSLLKFELQLQLSMLVLVMGNKGSNMDLTQKVILGVGILITVMFITLGFLGMRKENKALMAAFYLFGLSEPAYIGYKFYYAAMYERDSNATYESTFVCGCFAFAVWLALMVSTAYFSTHYFGKGLKEKMFESEKSTTTAASDLPNAPREGH